MTENVGKQKLKPCPFCGSDKISLHGRQGRSKIGTPYFHKRAVCKGCGISTPICSSPEKIERIWNRRAS